MRDTHSKYYHIDAVEYLLHALWDYHDPLIFKKIQPKLYIAAFYMDIVVWLYSVDHKHLIETSHYDVARVSSTL